eukprot:10814673-Alexandrium_andersonii.AAC.1
MRRSRASASSRPWASGSTPGAMCSCPRAAPASPSAILDYFAQAPTSTSERSQASTSLTVAAAP